MTLSTTAARVSYAGNGATTSFAFAFKVWAASDLRVYLRDTASFVDTLQVLTTDYTVSGALPGAGNVVFNIAPATGKTIVVLRDAATTQDLDLIANGAFAADNVETALDKIAGYVQALEEQTARALLMPVGTSLANLTLPEPRAAIANNLLAVNATGDGIAAVATSTLNAGQVVSAFVQTLLDDIDVATARQTLGLRALRQSGITYDPASLTAGSETESANITVTGAALGDSVMVFPPYDTQGIFIQGRVTAANTVRIRCRNGTAGTIDLANSAAWEVWVWKGGQP